jgi:hypothetical protein
MSTENQSNDEVSGDLMEMFEGPSDEGLGEAQRSQVAAARQTFLELEKLTKNILLYGREHQTTERFSERVFSSLIELIGQQEEIEFEVGPYEFTLFEQTVLENPNPERNFIYKLYLDGIRRLIFCRDITADQFGKFVDVLLTDWDDVELFEDDSVTLLWSANLESIKYSVLDNFAEDIREGDDNIYTVPGVIQQVRTSGTFQEGESESGHGVPRRLKRVNLVNSKIESNDLDNFREVYFAMDEAEFKRLRTVVHTTGREKLEKFIEILFKVHLIQELSEEDRRGRITALFDQISDLLLENHEVGELERLLRTIRRLTGPEDRVIRENVLAIEHIVEHWSAQPFIERVTVGLRRPDFREIPSVIAICEMLSRRAAPHIARVAVRVEDSETRNQLLELVKAKLSTQERPVADLLKEVDKRGSHQLLEVLKTVIDPDDFAYAVGIAMDNHDPSVRLEALGMIPTRDLERYQRILVSALADRAKMVRSKAVHLVARIRKPLISESIQRRIDSPEFQGYELDEKRRFYAACALTSTSPKRWLEQFQSNTLLATKGQDVERHCAAIALGICLCREAIPLLEKESKRRLRSNLVAEGVEWALQHIEHDREERTRQLYELFFYGRLSSGSPGEAR